MAKQRKDLVPGTLDLLVLKTLEIGPQHGYGIARRIQQASDDVLRVEEGSLYPALHRMAKRGWIRSEWGVSESNRRAKYYALTPTGKRRLVAERAEWERMADAVARVLQAEGGAA